MVAAIQKIVQGDLLVKGVVPFEDDMDRPSFVLNSPYLYLCCTSYPGNFAHICIWSLLDFCQIITSTPLLFMSYISLCEGTSLPQNLLCSFRSFAMWAMLPVFHNSSPIISFAETVYKKRARIQ